MTNPREAFENATGRTGAREEEALRMLGRTMDHVVIHAYAVAKEIQEAIDYANSARTDVRKVMPPGQLKVHERNLPKLQRRARDLADDLKDAEKEIRKIKSLSW